MKRALLSLAVLCAFRPAAHGHIGSPSVFFEGRAGAYALSAVIRPPAGLPGAVQVSVRSDEADLRGVSLVPVLWQAGRDGSPMPVKAEPVAGQSNLWSAEVWLLRPGSYSLQIRAEGARGAGEATVPVNVLGVAGQPMPPGLRLVLLCCGLLLLTGAFGIAQALARDGALMPGTRPTALDAARGRRVGAITLGLLLVGVAGGAMRWRSMDLAFRTWGAQRPEPVAALVHAEERRVVLELRQPEQAGPRLPWSAVVPDHGKLMHLFLIRAPAYDVFAHLHPVRQGDSSFALELPALPAGGYELYGELTYENGLTQTLVANVALPQQPGRLLGLPLLVTNLAGEVLCGYPGGPPPVTGKLTADPDDSWHLDYRKAADSTPAAPESSSSDRLVAPLAGGYRLVFENAAKVAAGGDTSLRFTVLGPAGREAELQPYMGMLGHAAVRCADGSVFAHLHPAGSFSMAAQEVFAQREGLADAGRVGPGGAPFVPQDPAGLRAAGSSQVSFPFQFPKPGLYRVWVQVRLDGRVRTGVFELNIRKT